MAPRPPLTGDWRAYLCGIRGWLSSSGDRPFDWELDAPELANGRPPVKPPIPRLKADQLIGASR